MKARKTSLLLIMMLAICFVSLSAENQPGAAQAVAGVHSGFRAQTVMPVLAGEGGSDRLVEGLSITEDGSVITLSWTAVPGATSYKVYSSDLPDFGFAEDTSGNFDGTSWTTIITATRRFYYVTSVGSEDPAEFVYVPGGTFVMGDTIDDGVGGSDELPTHSVTLDPFYIGKYEVTQGEWTAIMGSNPAQDYGVGDNYPVYFVSWYSILKYCNLRSIAEGLTPVYSIYGSTNPADWGEVPTYYNSAWDAAICNWSANGYRLPTEAEWEYAARGATNNPDYLYSGSNDIDAVGWYFNNWGNANDATHTVGGLAPNGIGTFDMTGNVYEWCWDWHSYDYYSNSPQNNPTGPAIGSLRLLRGGYWYNGESFCRVSYRASYGPCYGLLLHGFRLCRAIN